MCLWPRKAAWVSLAYHVCDGLVLESAYLVEVLPARVVVHHYGAQVATLRRACYREGT